MLHRQYYIYPCECNGPKFQVQSPHRKKMIQHMREVQAQIQDQLARTK
jgi:hypothetical protein